MKSANEILALKVSENEIARAATEVQDGKLKLLTKALALGGEPAKRAESILAMGVEGDNLAVQSAKLSKLIPEWELAAKRVDLADLKLEVLETEHERIQAIDKSTARARQERSERSRDLGDGIRIQAEDVLKTSKRPRSLHDLVKKIHAIFLKEALEGEKPKAGRSTIRKHLIAHGFEKRFSTLARPGNARPPL